MPYNDERGVYELKRLAAQLVPTLNTGTILYTATKPCRVIGCKAHNYSGGALSVLFSVVPSTVTAALSTTYQVSGSGSIAAGADFNAFSPNVGELVLLPGDTLRAIASADTGIRVSVSILQER